MTNNVLIMKTLFFALSIFLLFSCSGDDTHQQENSLTPPDWIIGSWVDESSGLGFRFESNDVVLLNPNASLSFYDFSGVINGFNEDTSPTDGSNGYSITYEVSDLTTTYLWIEVSSDRIDHSLYVDGNMTSSSLFRQ